LIDYIWEEKISLIEGEIDQDARNLKERFEVIVKEDSGREVFI